VSRVHITPPGEDRSAVVAVFESLEQAVVAVPDLVAAGVDPGWVSVAGREDPLDALNTPLAGRPSRAERLDAALGGDVAFPTATLQVRGLGRVAVGGWLASRILEQAAEASDPLAPLVVVGVPNERLEDHLEDLASDRCLVVVHGSPQTVAIAVAALEGTDAERLDTYAPFD
jgi:hypothetical protein